MLLVYFVGTLIFVREQRTMSYTMKDLTLTQADKEEICAHGLTVAQVEQQYQRLQTGLPWGGEGIPPPLQRIQRLAQQICARLGRCLADV